MATVASPKGFTPVGYISGAPYNGAVRHIKIASTLGNDIFTGDLVKILSSGTIDKEGITTASTANAALGVFLGCSYTDPTLKYKVFRAYWPASTVATDAMAFVADAPDLVFQIQADEAVPQAALGTNIALVNTAGNAATGRSKVAADGSTVAVTNTLPFKVVGFVEGGGNSIGDTYTEILVKWNFGMHHYDSATGI